jgi:hypothetical protein
VAAGGARRGRRDNGLDAAEYAVVADVDPRVGEHLLDVLAAGGIAAYLQPASDLNPVTRTTTVPARPTDRLYVDRQHLQTARDYLARLTGDEDATPAPRPPSAPAAAGAPTTPDIEAEWARLVAGFHEEVDPAARTWPAAEQIDLPARDPTHGPTGATTSATGGDPTADPAGTATADPSGPGVIDPTGAGAVNPTGPTAGRPRSPEALRRPVAPRDPDPDEPSLLDGLDTFGVDLPDEADDEEGYTPPPPPPLPRISKYAVAGILGVVGGFVLFLFPSLLPLDNGISMLLGFAGIIAGFVTLIWRLRPGDADDDADPDDGAVV